MSQYTPTDQEREIIRVMQSEKTDWEGGTSWVTDNVAFEMREVVQKARKNYFGIFDQDKDPVTGRKKIFIPFTEWVVETALKNIDIDTSDIDVMSRNGKNFTQSELFKFVLKNKLESIGFGKLLNKLLRIVCIDGTGFLEVTDQNGLHVEVVDRLNMIYDPSAESMEQSSGVMKRALRTLPEFQVLGYDNTEFVEGKKEIDRTGFDLTNDVNVSTETPYVEEYTRYGWLQKWTLTGKEKDKGTYVYAKTIVSELDDTPVVHFAQEIDREENPFTMFKFKEILNRADGRGIGEMLFMPQAYVNEITNLRLNTSRITQMGLWKIKGNITPQQVSRLFATSAIKLEGNDDIERIENGTIDNASYIDEDRAYLWGNRVTGTTQEDELAANRPATNALIQQQGSSKGYNLRMEDLFLSLQSAIEEKMIPVIKKNIKEGDILRITGDPRALEKLEEPFIKELVYRRIEEEKKRGNIITDEAMIDSLVEQIKEDRRKLGKNRWLEVKKELFDTDFDVRIVIGDEQINRAAMAQSLQGVIGLLAQAGLPFKEPLKELFDILGLPAEQLVEEQPAQAAQPVPGQAAVQAAAQPLPAGVGQLTETQQVAQSQ